MTEENMNIEVNADASETSVNATKTVSEETPIETPNLVDLQAQIQNLTTLNAKLKRANDKLASENGDLTKKYREKLSDDERKSLELAEAETKRQEEYDALKEQLNILQREKSISTTKSSYLGMGWTPDEADRMAIAEVENNFEERIKIMTEVNERKRKEYDVEALKSRAPIKTSTGAGDNITAEEFKKMGYQQMVALKQENPELFAKLSN